LTLLLYLLRHYAIDIIDIDIITLRWHY
jgi:chromatin segregation and condensation protein Rec8/ScpA/Scc1 (kleisin family)